MSRPAIDLVALPRDERVSTLVLLAHGGQEHSLDNPHIWRKPLLRMWPLALAARRALARRDGVAVGLLRYRYRGWNTPHAHAAADLRTVLDRLPASVERVALIGHSMGGRAVIRVADHERVAGALALAPWLPEADPVVPLPDRLVVLAHGRDDIRTDPALTSRYASLLRATGTSVAQLLADDETHALMRRYRDWDELARRFVASCLGDGDPYLAEITSTDPGRPPDPLPDWAPRSQRAAAGPLAIARARFTAPVRRRGWPGT